MTDEDRDKIPQDRADLPLPDTSNSGTGDSGTGSEPPAAAPEPPGEAGANAAERPPAAVPGEQPAALGPTAPPELAQPVPQAPAPAGPDSPWQQPAADPSVQYPAEHGAPPAVAPVAGDPMVTRSLPGAGPGQYGPPPPGTPAGWAQPAPQPPSRGKRWFAAGAAAVLLVVGGGVAGGVTVNALSGGSVVESPVVSNPASNKTGSLSSMVQQVMPTVVELTVQPAGGASGDEGSGVVIRSDGMILTNNHVVAPLANGGGSITVTFSNGKKTSATVVGTDATGDLAVVQAKNVSGLKVATLGDSSKLQVGDGVVAIGSPLGLQGSVTEGIVSALNRPYTASDQSQDQQNPFTQNPQQGSQSYTIPNAIQTDAAINPGNSGGPLLNMSGQVVGINSAIKGDSNIGIGFAIPINTAKAAADSLMKGQTVQHARLGVTVTDAISNSKSTSGTARGALVASVSAGGPAADAGLKKGDVITKVDGTAITDADSLVAAISAHKPGDKVTITYQRSGKTSTATATLGKQSS